MEKIVVTGGAGFIGSHIVERLVRDGYDVLVLDTLTSGKKENLASCLDRITFVHGSVLDPEVLAKAVTGATYVFHEAAIPSVPESIQHPKETHAINVDGTLAVFEAARKAGVKRVIYASSSAVYGDSDELPKRETMTLLPKSPYAVHKCINEQYGKLYAAQYGLETVGLRYFNVYGPRQDHHSEYSGVISKFISKLLQDEETVIFGDGKNTRDFVYVTDIVEANICAMKHGGVSGKVFNIGRGEGVSLIDLHSAIRAHIGQAREPRYSASREGDIRDSVADVSEAARELGFTSHVTLEQGLRETIAFFQS